MSALGWTNTEKLIVVLEEGSIAKYDIHGNYLHQNALPNVSIYIICTYMTHVRMYCNKLNVDVYVYMYVHTMHMYV